MRIEQLTCECGFGIHPSEGPFHIQGGRGEVKIYRDEPCPGCGGYRTDWTPGFDKQTCITPRDLVIDFLTEGPPVNWADYLPGAPDLPQEVQDRIEAQAREVIDTLLDLYVKSTKAGFDGPKFQDMIDLIHDHVAEEMDDDD